MPEAVLVSYAHNVRINKVVEHDTFVSVGYAVQNKVHYNMRRHSPTNIRSSFTGQVPFEYCPQPFGGRTLKTDNLERIL